jgi:GDP-L-fucose synthase
MADACVFLMKNYDEEGVINIGVGEDLSIKELAEMIKEITNYKGNIVLIHQSLMVLPEN